MACGTCRFLLLAALVVATAGRTTPASAGPFAQVDRTVIASLPNWHGAKAHIVDQLDLTHPFTTRTRWTLVVAKFDGPPPAALDESEDGGPLVVCFAKEMTPACSYRIPGTASSASWFDSPYHFLSGRVVFAGDRNTHPLLLVKTATAHSINGSHVIETQLFAYNRQTDRFEAVFFNRTGSNNNQETRFMEEGPLRGDIIVAEPTRDAPYAYWISVDIRDSAGRYSHRALRYRSATRYGDGNHQPVIHSEMPNILRHLRRMKLL